MSYNKCTTSILRCLLLIIITVFLTTISFGQDSTSWKVRGSNPKDYEMGGDPTIEHGSGEEAYLISKKDSIKGSGVYLTSMPAGEYLGKRLKMSAYVKAENVKDWLGLWMRVDGEEISALAFDNMQDRAIKGSTDWSNYNIVLDVPKNGVKIVYGILLVGTGKAWFDGLTFEVVNEDVAVTRGMNYNIAYALGEYKKALLDLEVIIKSNPDADEAEYVKIWYYIILRRDNQTEKAKEYLTGLATETIKDKWSPNIIKSLAGSITDDEFLNAANDTSAIREKEKKCEAYFYMGINHLFQDNMDKAKECFEKCLEHEVKGFVEPEFAKAELDRMKVE